MLQVSVEAVIVKLSVKTSETQRPRAMSRLLVAAVPSAIPIVAPVVPLPSPSFLVTADAVESQAPRQVQLDVSLPVVASSVK